MLSHVEESKSRGRRERDAAAVADHPPKYLEV
jgi:hypothetical protein